VSETKNEIKNLIKKINSLQIVEKEYSSIESKKKKLENELSELLDLLQTKNNEISKMEKFSFGGLIKSVFVDRKKVLDKKREEYYDLSKQYEKLKSEIAALNYESNLLGRKYNDFLRYKRELQALFEKREAELMTEDSMEGLTFRNMLDDIKDMKKEQAKILVSISIIDKLYSKLTLLSAALREVEGYGNWKTRKRMRRVDSYKNIAINNAKQYLLESNLMIKKLEQSLIGIKINSVNLYLKPIEFQGFLNVIFDNFITDIILRKKINDAIDNIEDVYRNLTILKNELRDKIESIEDKIKQLEILKKEVVSDHGLPS